MIQYLKVALYQSPKSRMKKQFTEGSYLALCIHLSHLRLSPSLYCNKRKRREIIFLYIGIVFLLCIPQWNQTGIKVSWLSGGKAHSTKVKKMFILSFYINLSINTFQAWVYKIGIAWYSWYNPVYISALSARAVEYADFTPVERLKKKATKWSCNLQQSTLTLTWVHCWLERSKPINWLVMSILSSYIIKFQLNFTNCSHGKLITLILMMRKGGGWGLTMLRETVDEN